jgi:hypothetical protein
MSSTGIYSQSHAVVTLRACPPLPPSETGVRTAWPWWWSGLMASAGIVEAPIHEHTEQLTMGLGERQTTEVLYPGPLPKGIYF